MNNYNKKMLKYFYDVLLKTEQLSTCYYYKVGCLLVKDNRIVISSYNGTPSKKFQCDEYEVLLNYAKNNDIYILNDIYNQLVNMNSVDLDLLQKLNLDVYNIIMKYLNYDVKYMRNILQIFLHNVKEGNFTNIIHSKYEIHAEQNAIIYANRFGVDISKSDLFVSYLPCFECAKIIIQSGIRRVFYIHDYIDKRFFDNTLEFLKINNIDVINLKEVLI